ncbi:hypothetical protein LMG28688_06356 [Paraburkholderia caffeinitolerans]|uniref:Uncharacterized protein n=1 Tax=Paraburkholderia caffeinitolerans TaxID=1723730 RepID=A0A6J5GVB9_9BURK|nr:hypothetical protein LMG28688_06356 [Paraburkholderia caffeinitolerans]
MVSATVHRRDALALIIPQPGVSEATRFPARPGDRLARPPRPVAKSGASASAPRTERRRSPVSRLAQRVLFWFDLAVLNVSHRIARWRLTSTHYGCEELHPSRTHLSPTCSILRARVVASSMDEKKRRPEARVWNRSIRLRFETPLSRLQLLPHTSRGLRLWPSSTSQSKSNKYAIAPGGMHSDAPASSTGPLPARMPHTRADSSRLVRNEATTHHCVARPRGSPHSENIVQARRQ